MTTENFPLTVRAHMTTSPETVFAHQTMADAHRVMRTHRLRHLPVLDGGRLVGLVSHRDLALVETLPDVDPAHVQLQEAMSTDVYAVSPDAPLRIVATEMAERKIGAAVVVAEGEVVGVFTAVDACRALAQALSVIAS
jgi:acetoin utilization protein AcuB